MKTCKECLHYEVCEDYYDMVVADLYKVADICVRFADRSEWARLPFCCKDTPNMKYSRWEQCFEDFRKQIEGDKCSACGFEHYGCSIVHYHYCPNCGARMVGNTIALERMKENEKRNDKH